MTDGPLSPNPGQAIAAACDALIARTPELAPLLLAFVPLLSEEARIRQSLTVSEHFVVANIDSERLALGIPLTAGALLLDSASPGLAVLWKDVALKLLPVISQGFPALAPAVSGISEALAADAISIPACLAAAQNGDPAVATALAARLDAAPEAIWFILSRLARPLLAKAAEGLRETVATRQWLKGFCPICGGAPDIGQLHETEGKRLLHCATCSHEWSFMRTMCPFCESQEHQGQEIFFLEGAEALRVEACLACNRSLPCVDTRKTLMPYVPELMVLAATPLEMLVREKGYMPGGVAFDLPLPEDNESTSHCSGV